MTDTRTLVVTIDSHGVPDDEWQSFKGGVNHCIDKLIPVHCHDGAQVWRRSDDVDRLLEADE